MADTKYLVTLLGIFRVSFTTLRDIYYLSQNEGTGPSILDMMRKIIEHGIAIEYMLLKGKEEMAERFQNYLVVQKHEEIELLKAIGLDPAAVSTELQIGIEDAEKEYAALDAGTKKDKTWAGRNFEGMLEDLTKAGAITAHDSPRLVAAYIWGCRLNHPNPFVVHGYLESEEHRIADDFYTKLGIPVAIAVHLRLATRLIDESRTAVGSNIYPEAAIEITAIQKELDSLT
ncbi:MAG: hypothetical protein KGI78_02635 [Patescibacteria group bacterium]|nr:hypothetical protein [Patescibacteria group bacterium]MDE2057728.1 hypothetical protein [Patescibacteria group bacterium]